MFKKRRILARVRSFRPVIDTNGADAGKIGLLAQRTGTRLPRHRSSFRWTDFSRKTLGFEIEEGKTRKNFAGTPKAVAPGVSGAGIEGTNGLPHRRRPVSSKFQLPELARTGTRVFPCSFFRSFLYLFMYFINLASEVYLQFF